MTSNDIFNTYEELMKNGGLKRGDILEIDRRLQTFRYLRSRSFAITTSDAKPTKTTADILCQNLKEILEDSGSSTQSKVSQQS